ncbi:MAG: glycosyltransferase family 4 protein [Sphingomicrobium sp.]
MAGAAGDPAPTTAPGPVIALGANDSWNLLNYRAGLIRALQHSGFRVAALTPEGPHSAGFDAIGVTFHPVPMKARGTSPLGDLRTLLAFRRQLKASGAAAFLGFTAKPNVYGTLAASNAHVPAICNISGLGAVFGRAGPLQELLARLYRVALRRASTVFFQNRDDLALFEAKGLVDPAKADLLPGSGVDLERFSPGGGKRADGPFTFLFAARLLWDKGVREFADAARIVRARRSDVRFQILGFVEPEGRTAVPLRQLRDWQSEGVLDYLGATGDVRSAVAAADCVVLPSYYREGVPRVLLEAAAMGRPLITTDAPGCREAVDDHVTGLLCQPRSVDSLVAAMEALLAVSVEEREAMGQAGRAKMERQFDEKLVHRAYLSALAKAGLVSPS